MAGDYDNSKPHEYCVVHDRPLEWCGHPDKCVETMTSWGLYDPSGDTQQYIDQMKQYIEKLAEDG